MTYAVARLQVGYTENVESSLATNNQQKRTGINWSSTSPDEFTNEFLNFLTESIDSRVTNLQVNIFGVDITFDDSALEFIANKAFDNKTGARGLKTIIEKSMNNLMFELPDKENIKEVIVSADTELRFDLKEAKVA